MIRAETAMPDYYMPSVKAVAIAGEDILQAIGHQPGAFDPPGWSHDASGFKKGVREGRAVLCVQRCGRFWIIERVSKLDGGEVRDEALMFALSPIPIWTRTRQSAMHLAEYCDPVPRPPMSALWADVGNVRVTQVIAQ
jgi:hypothetical protein